MQSTAGVSFIQSLEPYLPYAALALPFLFVVWQAAFPAMLGSRRHLRSFGVSAYVSGLSLLMGGIVRSKAGNDQSLLVVFVITFVLGLVLGLVVLMVREDATGGLEMAAGPKWARVIGVSAYLFCAYLAFDLSKLGVCKC